MWLTIYHHCFNLLSCVCVCVCVCVALLDRRWAEERKKHIEEKQNEEQVFAEGVQIASNITKLARKRTDIFGREETVIGLEVGGAVNRLVHVVNIITYMYVRMCIVCMCIVWVVE